MPESTALPVIRIAGLTPDSLGNYLASLGLVRVLTRRWPGVRCAWQGRTFAVVGGPTVPQELVDELCDIAGNAGWSRYERRNPGWYESQTSDKQKTGMPLAVWRASADEHALELFDAHIVAPPRYFNPLLGNGGSSGNRDFSDGWKRAVSQLASKRSEARDDLVRLIVGEPQRWMVEKLNAACWFSSANKLYNSGQAPFREGVISPWLMALACEGLPFFAGAPSRRLGSRTNRDRVAAFPFITRCQASESAGQVERDQAEVWAPLWERPMSVPEIRVLFSRGRAEVRSRGGAVTPSQFAVAIAQRGVDAGITGFARFVLGRTTSGNTFEPRSEGIIDVTAASSDHVRVRALEAILDLINQLPEDRKRNKPFAGLRGPLERALIDVVKRPRFAERSRNLLDAMATVLDRIDRNAQLRARQISWKPLPNDWVPELFGDACPPLEARLSLALVASFPRGRPFAAYRFGVTGRNNKVLVHEKIAPARWVWRQGDIGPTLCEVLLRWLLDWSADVEKSPEIATRRNFIAASLRDVDSWLSGNVDDDLFTRWLSRLALFDWNYVPQQKTVALPSPYSLAVSPLLCLFGLMQPLFDLQPVKTRFGNSSDLLPEASGARTPAAARRLAALLLSQQFDAALAFAASRYAVANLPIARRELQLWEASSARLLSSMLIPVSAPERTFLLDRWLGSTRKKEEVAYA